ncbi:hypothetical protein NQ314_015456 [Rhamnusium bicolor]|uniref:Enoyl reductase (ER) domain-containing protein n=1 Tax=Rhamnusium bicolor TaxID=1586634 RepID=A0AAV8WYM4_9CUCU|nr:hypothetical protein NQ314_015456 [Rhamnusium bicolor]
MLACYCYVIVNKEIIFIYICERWTKYFLEVHKKIENIQLQTELAATKTKDVLILYSQQCKLLVLKLWNSITAEQLKNNLKENGFKLISVAKDFYDRVIIYIASPRHLLQNLLREFGKKWTKRDIYFGCAGFLIGGIIGLTLGLALRKKDPILRYMQAIQSNEHLGTESVTVVEDAIAPYECGDYDVLVNVKAASVQIVDFEICKGYGKTLRKILQRIYNQSNSENSVILGRDCTGIITDLGAKVKRLEVGDEVWLAVPFWSQGTLCQSVLVSDNWVSRKPKNIGFEGACSLPYAGSLALSALSEANIDSSNACQKKILVQGGCTPVGCVLVQLLRHWNAVVTTSCYKRAVPVVKALGASDIIIMSEPSNLNNKSFVDTETENEVLYNALLKELELRGNLYDVIIITNNDCNVNADDLSKFCMPNGTVISTLPPFLASDSCGPFSRLILALYIKLKYKIQVSFT